MYGDLQPMCDWSIYTRTFQEVSINSLLEVKECPKTTCWKVLVYTVYIRSSQGGAWEGLPIFIHTN